LPAVTLRSTAVLWWLKTFWPFPYSISGRFHSCGLTHVCASSASWIEHKPSIQPGPLNQLMYLFLILLFLSLCALDDQQCLSYIYLSWNCYNTESFGLRCKPEDSGFNSRWCHWNFSWHNPFSCIMVLGSAQPLTEMSTKNISLGSKGGRCVRLTTLPPLCTDYLEIWELHHPGSPRVCPGLCNDGATFLHLTQSLELPALF
jgi:hypothetical protein